MTAKELLFSFQVPNNWTATSEGANATAQYCCYPTEGWVEAGRETENEMAGWHHWLDGRESGWTLGVGDGQEGLACCDTWGRKKSDTTERLNWTELIQFSGIFLVYLYPFLSTFSNMMKFIPVIATLILLLLTMSLPDFRHTRGLTSLENSCCNVCRYNSFDAFGCR